MKLRNQMFLVVSFLIGVLVGNRIHVYGDIVRPQAQVITAPTVTDAPFPPDAMNRAKTLVDHFEEAQKKINAKEVMALFTPPKNANEADAFTSMMGYDLPDPSPRLFMIANLSYKLRKFGIISTKQQSNLIVIEVMEDRDVYDNTTGKYFEMTVPVLFETQFYGFNPVPFVTNYYVKGKTPSKYGGFYGQ